MRRTALALLLVLTACSTATGVQTELCDATWRSREARILEPGGVDERTVPIDCIRPIERRRVRIGFTMPAGPDCFRISRIAVVESADAVSITLFVARNDDANIGACADAPQRVNTEIDLQAETGSRRLLDGSAPGS